MENKRARILLGRMLTILALILLTSSCGLFKKTSRTAQKETVQIEVKKDSVEVLSEQVNVSEKNVNKDINTMITETETTTRKTTKGTSGKVQITQEDLSSGKENILLDNNGREIAVLLDSISKVLTITVSAPDQIEETVVKVKKTEHIDRSTENSKDSTKVLDKQVAVTTEDKLKSSSSESTRESKPSGSVIFWLILVGILVLYLVYRFIIKRFIP